MVLNSLNQIDSWLFALSAAVAVSPGTAELTEAKTTHTYRTGTESCIYCNHGPELVLGYARS